MVINPLSAKARGHVYVAAIVAGGVALVGTAVLTTIGLTEWAPLPGVVASALSIVASNLARDNLTEDSSNG